MSLAITRGHAIFLDQEADRYFALPDRENQSLIDLLDGLDIGIDARHRLAEATGVIARRDVFLAMMAAPSHWRPRADNSAALPMSKLRLRDRLDAILERAKASVLLRVVGLERTLARITRMRRRRHAHENDLARVIAAQRWLDQHLSAADACLTRSLALVRCARARGCDVQLVIGVKTSPFEAHCWVQTGDCILNDDIDRIAPFTPIVILP
ncbi:lasso peptide biosynthesis B2 protein [Sphingomonas sp. SUN019]|uniref:lasso peptide biosynthesis B2 protein n=1 Tax=Sphingomonas sp. SUN019 TaxID=2937788 RepID=UPI002164C90B|nr:lasso peptide biosynthesis B2 protein [Sphingomonas sp. SUN019]UVO50147.1 lasso peptide biosynthesis B2 protein [Sphingomonas sp. SUN019]